jgi:hypothetical protein
MDNKKIGFYSLYETAALDSYVGAILITNENGIPLEFKCTHSVKPTAIQKSLYGNKLKPYIAINLCAIPLIFDISNKPEILFIDIPEILSLRTDIEIPTILLRRAGDFTNLQIQEEVSENIRLENPTGQFQALALQSHPNFSNEIKLNTDLINELFKNFDLAEPFDRMKISIDILGNNDPKFK